MVRSELLLLATWSILALSKQDKQRYDARGVDQEAEPLSWAVDLSRDRSWPLSSAHWLLGKLTDHELSARADALAAKFQLINKGPQPGFKNIFKFELSSDSFKLRLKRDGQVLINGINEGLVGHNDVMWAAQQYPLKRTKRLFNDPKFKAQWHLVSLALWPSIIVIVLRVCSC